jgi:4-hydroxy-tetrahydrodipicolinate synthase
MVGTGLPDLETTTELTRFAHEQGFAAALVLPPFYYKGISDDGLFAWFEALVAATEAAPIPLYLYNFPQMTGIVFSPEVARRLAEAFPDRIRGAKDSSGDLGYAAQLAEIEGFDVFPSSEVALATADGYGFAGCISASVNVAPSLSAALWTDRRNTELLSEVERVRTGVSAQPLIPAVKYLVGRIHGDDDYEALRPPLMPLDDEQKAALDGLGIV